MSNERDRQSDASTSDREDARPQKRKVGYDPVQVLLPPEPFRIPRSDSIHMSHPSCPVGTKLSVRTHDITINISDATKSVCQQSLSVCPCRSSITRKSRGIMMA